MPLDFDRTIRHVSRHYPDFVYQHMHGVVGRR